MLTFEQERDLLLSRLPCSDEYIQKGRDCKQKTQLWKDYRQIKLPEYKYPIVILTASNTGKINGTDNKTPEKYLVDMVWGDPFTGNDFTDYGNFFEYFNISTSLFHISKYHLEKNGIKNVIVRDYGIEICKEHPWLGASVDGVILGEDPEGQSVECCCPPGFHDYWNKKQEELEKRFPKKEKMKDEMGSVGSKELTFHQKFYGKNCRTHEIIEAKCPARNLAPYPSVPLQYYDQFQTQGYVTKASKIWFSVYSPLYSQLSYFDMNLEYWEKTLFPNLKDFYFNRYLKSFLMRERGMLQRGQVDVVISIVAEPKLFNDMMNQKRKIAQERRKGTSKKTKGIEVEDDDSEEEGILDLKGSLKIEEEDPIEGSFDVESFEF